MARKNSWNLSKRINFQSLLKQGYSLAKVYDIWTEMHGESLSVASLGKEVALGLTPEEYKNKQYVRYDIMKVYKNLLGEDAVEYIQENGNVFSK